MELATSLRNHGVDAILDKWRLKPGQDKYVFMESMVTDPEVSKVLILCDKAYKTKADSRSGGVGTESQIISAELYSKVTQTKFIPVIFERDDKGNAFLPAFMLARMYVDMSSTEAWGDGLDQLLRQIFDQPLYPEPGLGEAPSFAKNVSTGLPLAKDLSSTLRSIREARPNRAGLEATFIRNVFAELAKLYVQPEGIVGYDDAIFEAITRTKGLRDQIAEYLETVALFDDDRGYAGKHCIHLLEELAQNFRPPVINGVCVDGWADLYRFFALETVLLTTASFIRHERWASLGNFLNYPYLICRTNSSPYPEGIVGFDNHLPSLDEHRNSRLKLNRKFVSADLLKERCSVSSTTFRELIQADVFIALYCSVNLPEERTSLHRLCWSPRTTVYTSDASYLPIFLKATGGTIKTGIIKALGLSSSSELRDRLDIAREKLNNFSVLQPGRFSDFSFEEAINAKNLIK